MTNRLKQIEQPASLTTVTVGRIREAIIAGELSLGSKLSEQRLADLLGISRSPVRDALALLQSEGLVVISPKRGSFVFTPNLKQIDDIREHRCILEIASFRRAINHNRQALIDGMNQAVSEMQKAIEKSDPAAYTKGDINFHNAVIRCGDNQSIAQTYSRTIGPLMALRTHLFTTMHVRTEESMNEHLNLLAACKLGDIETVEKTIEAHTGHLVDAYRAALAKEPSKKKG